MKRLMSLLLAVVMTIGVCGTAFAGQWTEDLHGRYYTNDDGSYPTNKWQWIDDDGDGIAQCYYFDNSGYSVRNGKTPDGYETNMEGQWVIDGVVQQQNAADVPVNGAQLSASAAYTGTPIVVLAEYQLRPKYSSYVYYFYVIQNTSLNTLRVEISSLAYSADGSMVAAEGAHFTALGPGCCSLIYVALRTDEDVANVVTTWKTEIPSWYASVIQNLSCVQNNISNGVILQLTNNGIYTAESVKEYVLFFKNGKLVDWDWAAVLDVEPGETKTNQINSYQDFDSIQVYLDGYHFTL